VTLTAGFYLGLKNTRVRLDISTAVGQLKRVSGMGEYHDEDMRKLSKLLERAILGAINRDLEKIRYGGGVLNVDVTIDVKQDYDSEEIYERFKETGGSDLTPAEVGVLVRDGKIGTEEMEALRVENTS
jgi:hypothetical protein